MDAALKKVLKSVTLELRHRLEGRYDAEGRWHPGDLEQRLAALGVRRDRDSARLDEMPHLSEVDRQARRRIDAYLQLRADADVPRDAAVAEFVRETASTWANRLLALRCMESRELIDPVILQQDAYGGRSLEHHRLAQRTPELCAGEDDGLFAVLDNVFREQSRRLPLLFDPESPAIALRPSPAALKECLGLLSGHAEASPYTAPDALGWAYQYWNTEEKDRVFEKVRTVKGAKIAGADIIPATQLYTEDYMVKFLVQNSLGATWMQMHPDSRLAAGWDYYVRDADRAQAAPKPLVEITFLDPACGSGHFLIEAFDLFYAMYEEAAERGWETGLTGKETGDRRQETGDKAAISTAPVPSPLSPEALCTAILTKNLYGIDIDARAVQIAEAALWMKGAERAFDFDGAATNLVAAVGSHLRGPKWDEFLAGFEREPSVARVLRRFAETMEHIDQIGSLARPDEDLREIIREEHRVWERQVRETKSNYLFPEMRADAVSGHLPFEEITDDAFGHRMFNRAQFALDAFTQAARERGEFQDQLMGKETRTGFRLVELLSRRYDVVAANPPYMGSKNMGPALRPYIERAYSVGKRDLSAAFMLQAQRLVAHAGRTAMVVPQTWLFAKTYASLRLSTKGQSRYGLLVQNRIEVLAQLGRHAFDEADPPTNVILVGWQSLEMAPHHEIRCFRISAPRPAQEQASILRAACSNSQPKVQFAPKQADFLELPNAPLVYYIHPSFFDLLKSGNHLGDCAVVRQGLATANKNRFIRFVWEVSNEDRWRRAAHGGGFGRWWGPNFAAVEWGFNGARIKHSPGVRVQSEAYYGRDGYWYAQVARGSLGLRRLSPGSIFTNISSGVFRRNDGEAAGHSIEALLNSRVANYLLRAISQKAVFSEGYPPLLPWPENLNCGDSVEFAFRMKRLVIQSDHITDADFSVVSSNSVSAYCSKLQGMDFVLSRSALRHAVEGFLDRSVFRALNVPDAAIEQVVSDTRSPSGWYELIRGFDQLPAGAESFPPDALEFLARHGRLEISNQKLIGVRQRLRRAFEAGWDAEVDDEGDPDEITSEESDESDVDAQTAVRADSFLEGLSQIIEVHPISVYWLIREGVEAEGWRCLPEERRIWGDRITVTVLRMLGHRWPKQIEAGEPVPDWADPDGIIPLTPLAEEVTLFDRVRQRLEQPKDSDAPPPAPRNDNPLAEFAEVTGKPLDAWLATEFFKHHTKQFKKRPIAWQIQSGKSTARKAPAFACLVYYHQLDADTLPKIRTQYVGPLRQRLETELRGLSALASDARNDRQEKRRRELEEAVQELAVFDAKLDQVSREGFASPVLSKLMETEPCDRVCSLDGRRAPPTTRAELLAQEAAYAPDINDGVRVNIAPLQKAGLLAADVLAKKDVEKAIADRAEWRSDERRWVREGKLPQPGWWPESGGET